MSSKKNVFDESETKKLANEKGCVESMNKLGDYYNKIGDFDQMKKYYLMAIEKGNSCIAMTNLGAYYDMKDEYDDMMKYYFMAIEKGCCTVAMTNLGEYYHDVENDYEKMKKYYLMAIENGSSNTLKYFNLYIKTYDLLKYKQYLDKDNTKKLTQILRNYLLITNCNDKYESASIGQCMYAMNNYKL